MRSTRRGPDISPMIKCMTDNERIFDCICKGRNPNCYRCDGKGVVHSVSDATFERSELWKDISNQEPPEWLHKELAEGSNALNCCLFCPKFYKTRNGLLNHLIRHHNAKASKLNCKVVFGFETESMATKWIVQALKDRYMVDFSKLDRECPICSKECKHRQGIIDHLHSQHEDVIVEPKIECPLCSKAHKTPIGLIGHLVSAHNSITVYNYFFK